MAVFIGKESSHLPQKGLALFKARPVVVANENMHRARFDVAVQFIDVEEAFMAFGVFRFFPGRQELLPFGGHGQGVFILPLASPVWTLRPWKVMVQLAALKFSYSRPPNSPPSTV